MSERPLPHILSPLPEESLFGFGVRLMRANRFPAGGMPEVVGRHTSQPWRDRPSAYASGKSFDLGRLATLSGNALESIEALTFGPVLRRVYGTPDPSIRSLGVIPFAICPGCWASNAEMHRLAAFLPGAIGCDAHGVALETSCTCGRPLSMSPHAVGLCGGCGSRWSALIARPLSASEAELQRRLRLAYKTAFGVPAASGTESFGVMLQRLRERSRARGRTVMPFYLNSVSIERMVSIFVALGGNEDLMEELRQPQPAAACPNAACPAFDLANCTATVERHCRACGTRFVGPRILSTFDLDHGRPSPSATQVRRARRRLAGWRRSLRQACDELRAVGEPLEIEQAFAQARVPLNANLRAPRLGLTAIVRASQALASGRAADAQPITDLVRKKVFAHDVDWLSAWARRSRRAREIPDGLFRPPRPHEQTYDSLWRALQAQDARDRTGGKRSRSGVVCSLPISEER
jgi:hypothetical protein